MRGTCKNLGIIALFVTFCATINCEHKEFQNRYDPLNLPAAPVLLFPENGITYDSVDHFEWTIAEDTLSLGDTIVFEIQIDTVNVFQNSIHDTTLMDIYVPDFQYIYSFYISSDDTYYWHVRVRYLDGGWGPWSEVFDFTIAHQFSN